MIDWDIATLACMLSKSSYCEAANHATELSLLISEDALLQAAIMPVQSNMLQAQLSHTTVQNAGPGGRHDTCSRRLGA